MSLRTQHKNAKKKARKVPIIQKTRDNEVAVNPSSDNFFEELVEDKIHENKSNSPKPFSYKRVKTEMLYTHRTCHRMFDNIGYLKKHIKINKDRSLNNNLEDPNMPDFFFDFVADVELIRERGEYKKRQAVVQSSKTKLSHINVFFGKSDNVNVLKRNNEILTKRGDKMSLEEKIVLRKENLLYIQKFFYRVMEAHSHIFKISSILYLHKRKQKDPYFHHDLFITNLKFYEISTAQEKAKHANAVVSISNFSK